MSKLMLVLLLPAAVLAMPVELDTELFIEVHILPATGFTVVGMEYTGSNPAELVDLWSAFTLRMNEVPRSDIPFDMYGLLLDYDMESGEFKYLACVISDVPAPVPEGMVTLDIPASTYAVFDFPFYFVDEIYGFAYDEWLPESDFVHGEGYDFEFYYNGFDVTDENSMMQLYVSVTEE